MTVSKYMLMSSANVSVRTGGLLWFKSCCDGIVYVVLVEWSHLKPYCVEMCGIIYVMYGSSVFFSVFLL